MGNYGKLLNLLQFSTIFFIKKTANFDIFKNKFIPKFYDSNKLSTNFSTNLDKFAHNLLKFLPFPTNFNILDQFPPILDQNVFHMILGIFFCPGTYIPKGNLRLKTIAPDYCDLYILVHNLSSMSVRHEEPRR